MKDLTVICKICKAPFERSSGRGRPAVKCLSCRTEGTHPLIEIKKIDAPAKSETPLNASAPLVENKTEVATIAKAIPEKKQPRIAVGETYVLMVGNLGMAYGGEDEKEAKKQFLHYSKASAQGFGQVGFEIVQLWKRNGENYDLEYEFIPVRDVNK